LDALALSDIGVTITATGGEDVINCLGVTRLGYKEVDKAWARNVGFFYDSVLWNGQ